MRIENLILIRLATIESMGPKELADQLRPLVGGAGVGPQVRALIDGGWITQRPLRITDKGRKRAAAALGVDAIPSWRTVRSRLLPELALGVSMADKKTTLLEAVAAHLLVKFVDVSPRSAKPKDIVEEAVRKALKLTRADAAALQAAVARQWVAEERAVVMPDVQTPSRPVDAPKVWNDDDVIEAVRRATPRVPPAGRFGDDRVFVSAIWRHLGEDNGFPGLTLDGFKSRLVAANRRQQLTLARADLVGAMDQHEVAESEIRYLNSTFHFVVDRSRS